MATFNSVGSGKVFLALVFTHVLVPRRAFVLIILGYLRVLLRVRACLDVNNRSDLSSLKRV